MKTMSIRINPGKLQSSEAIVAWTERRVRTSLRRFTSRITRVEVHFADLNGPKEGKTDLRCTMEARINGRKPLAVEHRAENLYAAIDGAARRLRTAVNRAVDRVNSRAHRIAHRRARGAAVAPRRETTTQGPARPVVFGTAFGHAINGMPSQEWKWPRGVGAGEPSRARTEKQQSFRGTISSAAQ